MVFKDPIVPSPLQKVSFNSRYLIDNKVILGDTWFKGEGVKGVTSCFDCGYCNAQTFKLS